MAATVFIDGAAGTTGLEIRERLAGRDEFSLILLDDARRKDEAARRDALHAADFAIVCLPDEAAKEAAKLAEGSGTRIIDASSAHRVAEGWTYGFPELIGHDKIANARFVSNPGCYPTGFLALVAPLVRAGLLPAAWPYTVNAVSGYSGGGNALIERFEQFENLEGHPGIAFRAYGRKCRPMPVSPTRRCFRQLWCRPSAECWSMFPCRSKRCPVRVGQSNSPSI